MRDTPLGRYGTVARALRILAALADGRWHTLNDLGRRVDVCQRTIRRYMDALDESGFHVEHCVRPGDVGPVGHWRLVDPAAAHQALARRRSA